MMRLAVAIPDSAISESEQLREKTVKLGYIARALTIFRVSNVYIYVDPTEASRRDGLIMREILGYIECPQYLRRHLYGRSAGLRYAGLLPPLRAPHHKLRPRDMRQLLGDVRDGVITGARGGMTFVDIGLGSDAILRGSGAKGSRITCAVEQVEPRVMVRHADVDRIPSYWGYKIHGPVSLESIPYNMFDLTVMTSRFGRSVSELRDDFFQSVQRSTNMLILFGSPRRGLRDIYAKTGVRMERVGSHVLNMIPEQGSVTIRVEEAMMATLSILNLAAHSSTRR